MQRLMNPPCLLRQIFVRVFLTALAAALLATLASCGSPNASDPGIDIISSQIDALNESVSVSKEQADKLVFWQITVAFLIVVSGFALIFGAAMGSITRRDVLRRAREEPELQPQTQTKTHNHTDYDNHDEEPR